MKIPTGHQVVMPYLMLKGAANFIDFVQKIFDAQLTEHKMREDKVTIMHSEIQIAGCTIMFCEVPDQMPPQIANLFVYVADVDETYQKAINAGATSLMELSNQDYGRTGGITDPCGNVWWITTVNN